MTMTRNEHAASFFVRQARLAPAPFFRWYLQLDHKTPPPPHFSRYRQGLPAGTRAAGSAAAWTIPARHAHVAQPTKPERLPAERRVRKLRRAKRSDAERDVLR
jgi:hypothetical protein